MGNTTCVEGRRMVKAGDRIRVAVKVIAAENGVMTVVKIGGVEYVKKEG